MSNFDPSHTNNNNNNNADQFFSLNHHHHHHFEVAFFTAYGGDVVLVRKFSRQQNNNNNNNNSCNDVIVEGDVEVRAEHIRDLLSPMLRSHGLQREMMQREMINSAADRIFNFALSVLVMLILKSFHSLTLHFNY